MNTPKSISLKTQLRVVLLLATTMFLTGLSMRVDGVPLSTKSDGNTFNTKGGVCPRLEGIFTEVCLRSFLTIILS